MDAREAINRGLLIYRTEMRVLIRQTLQAEFKERWFGEKVVPLLPRDKRRRARAALNDGERPEDQIDVGDFREVVAKHSDLFPQAIRKGEPAHARFDEIRKMRNAYTHDSGPTPRRLDAESLLDACADLLRQCKLDAAATDIDDLKAKLLVAARGTEQSARSPIENAVTAATSTPVEIRRAGAWLLGTRIRVGFVLGLLIGGLVGIAIFVLQETSNVGGSEQEQTAAGTQQASSADDRGGDVQEPASVASGDDDSCRVAGDLQLSDMPIQRHGTWSSSDCESPWTGRSYSDRYRIHLSERTSVTITLTSDGERPYLTLFSEDEEPLASDDAGEGGNSQIMRTLGAGTYYVEAATYRRNQTGSYNLRVSYAALQTATELAIPQDLVVVQARLARALFGPGKPTYHDYNSYGAQVPGWAGGCRGYDGGHSGWDAQTQSVAGAVPTRDEPFFSLTTGVVIRAGGDDFNTIAVYDAVQDVTTLYAHARRVDVRVGQTVRVGTQLGIQGNAGLSSDPTDREHVHVEVRRGRVPWLACGATGAINPFNYLYHSVTAAGS